MGLGSVSLVSLAEAREKALVNRKMAREGGDPLAARREQQAVMTFEQASRRVHELHSPTWRNAKHRLDFISSLERYAFPRLCCTNRLMAGVPLSPDRLIPRAL